MEKAIPKTEEEWRERLTEEQYHVLREAGTEQAFTGKYWNHHDDGAYTCAACGAVLFASDTKFDSGTGWPSFDRAAAEGAVTLHEDSALGMKCTEVRCAKCGGHLGHVFPDGPGHLPDGRQATGQRFCINSCALDFKDVD